MRVIARGTITLLVGATTSVVTVSGLQETDMIVVSPTVLASKTTVLRGHYKNATEITVISSGDPVTGDKALWMVLRND